MTDPKQLTEEMPETNEDLKARGLILDSGGLQAAPGQRILTEDLPQEEDEETGPRTLAS